MDGMYCSELLWVHPFACGASRTGGQPPWPVLHLASLNRLAIDIQMVELIPHTRDLKIFVEVDDHVAQNVHRPLRSLGPGRHHSFQSGDDQRMAIRQADRFMMKARQTFLAARFGNPSGSRATPAVRPRRRRSFRGRCSPPDRYSRSNCSSCVLLTEFNPSAMGQKSAARQDSRESVRGTHDTRSRGPLRSVANGRTPPAKEIGAENQDGFGRRKTRSLAAQRSTRE